MTAVAFFTETEKVAVLQRCGYPAYGWLGTFDPFQLYFSTYWQAQAKQVAPDVRMAAVLTAARVKLVELDKLDAAIIGAGENLDTDQAAVWHRNRSEVQDRAALANMRRRELCALLGVEPGPALASGRMTVRTVV